MWAASEAAKAADEAIAASVEKGAAGPAPAAPGTAPGATPTEYATPRTTQVRAARVCFKERKQGYALGVD